jgi:hypothetical protein
MSPSKQKREESLLFAAGQDGEVTNHSVRELFASGEGIRSPEVSITKNGEKSNRNFGNSTCSAYFNADINGSGVADVVALSQFGLFNIGKEIHPLDVQYSTDVANFVLELSMSQRNELSHLFKATVSKVKRDERNQRMWKTTIPTTPFVMRKQYCDGNQSFLQNLPVPNVQSVGEHAYVSLRECIRLRLAFGYPLERLEVRETNAEKSSNVRTLMQSECCQRIVQKCKGLYKEPVLILFLKEWQDGYDPHSFSKANRGSAWIKMVTIAEPHEHRNSPEVRNLFCSNNIHFHDSHLLLLLFVASTLILLPWDHQG